MYECFRVPPFLATSGSSLGDTYSWGNTSNTSRAPYRIKLNVCPCSHTKSPCANVQTHLRHVPRPSKREHHGSQDLWHEPILYLPAYTGNGCLSWATGRVVVGISYMLEQCVCVCVCEWVSVWVCVKKKRNRESNNILVTPNQLDVILIVSSKDDHTLNHSPPISQQKKNNNPWPHNHSRNKWYTQTSVNATINIFMTKGSIQHLQAVHYSACTQLYHGYHKRGVVSKGQES